MVLQPRYEVIELLHTCSNNTAVNLLNLPLLHRFLSFFRLPFYLLVLLTTAEKSTQQTDDPHKFEYKYTLVHVADIPAGFLEKGVGGGAPN